MSETKPLLIIFRPREIPQVLEAIAKLKVDKLWMNYYPQYVAYPLARMEFLKRDYTHLVIMADDLVPTVEGFELLKSECNEYDSISGWMNNWIQGPWSEYSDISFKLPPDPPSLGSMEEYEFVKISVLENMTGPIISVPHQGTCLTFLKREIVERIPFRTDCGCCPDSLFSIDCHNAGVLQHIDLRVRLLHLKWADNPPDLYVGKKQAAIVFETGQ